MNQPPFGSDPDATQPIPVTPVAPPPRGAPARAVAPGAAPAIHRFGNVPFYVLARFLAFAIDGFAIAFFIAVFTFNAFEPGGPSLLSQRDEGGFGILLLASFGGAFLIAFVCEGLFGTTLGKAVFALHVRRVDGRHAGVGRVFLRALFRPLDVLVIGPVLALVTPRHQRVGDFAGGTVVAHSRVGPLVSVVAILLLGGLAYAQIAFGGGLTSALGVAAEAAAFGPDYASKAAALVGFAIPRTPLPAPRIPGLPAAGASPSPAPEPAASAPAATPSPVSSAPAAGGDAEGAYSPAPAPTDTPDAAESDAPAGV